MLRVDSNKPCKLVYSICKHAFLGYLIEPHIVQLNAGGNFSFTHQRLFTTTAGEFDQLLDETDYKLIAILEDIEQSAIIKYHYKKTISPFNFFSTVFNDKLYERYRPKIEARLAEALPLLKNKELYVMSIEGWPLGDKLYIASEPATILFHFRRSATETRYFPTLKYQGTRIEFMFKNAEILCNLPAWLLLDNVLYYFKDELEGKKLQPFLNKRFISIPTSAESVYFERFVAPLIEKHAVYAEGFEIKSQTLAGKPILNFCYDAPICQLSLSFRYGEYVFPANEDKRVSVCMEKNGEDYIFHRIKRSVIWEKNKLNELLAMGLQKDEAFCLRIAVQQTHSEQTSPLHIIDWLNEHYEELQEKDFVLEQSTSEKHFLLARSKIDIEIKEKNDWFDIHAIVYFGIHQIPFIQLKNHILNRIKEFKLPTGEIAVIPEKWFSQFSNLLGYTEGGAGDLKLKKHYIGLVNDLKNCEWVQIAMDRKLQKLADFEEIAEVALPMSFNGTLRPYQKAGYNWFHFLRKYNFGGCLADDMGLGKTVQTLALLQKVKEENRALGIQSTSLIVMPTSLIYNWQNEAAKFAPELKILVYTGSLRHRNIAHFTSYDLVFTTYGVVRLDAQAIKINYFDYIILDESQNIKNAASKAFKAVKLLKSHHKLILSGTPVENTVNDLWAQMSFINPGLLGSQAFFQTDYVTPIEKKSDEACAQKLQALIKPFILRRTKNLVATELPPKTEHLFYCKMSDEQAEYYEKTKSHYRNELLQSLENGTFSKSVVQFLQGLTKLRQIANHPLMIDKSYEGDSGKFENVIPTLANVLSRGHRVLVFSQFVKQLAIYRNHFDTEKITYAYLDGATKNRGAIVKEFQENNKIKLFLISMKAGGVGLNLTQADYVFILDPWWNPAVEQQAIDRTHRIGQTKNVFIYKFITKDTVEEKIVALQNRKRIVADSLITTEEGFAKSLSAQDFLEILR